MWSFFAGTAAPCPSFVQEGGQPQDIVDRTVQGPSYLTSKFPVCRGSAVDLRWTSGALRTSCIGVLHPEASHIGRFRAVVGTGRRAAFL